jgi:hypothetical protein
MSLILIVKSNSYSLIQPGIVLLTILLGRVLDLKEPGLPEADQPAPEDLDQWSVHIRSFH